MHELVDKVVDARCDRVGQPVSDGRVLDEAPEEVTDEGGRVNLLDDRIGDHLRDGILHCGVVDERADRLEVLRAVDHGLVAPVAYESNRGDNDRENEDEERGNRPNPPTLAVRHVLS